MHDEWEELQLSGSGCHGLVLQAVLGTARARLGVPNRGTHILETLLSSQKCVTGSKLANPRRRAG